MFATGEIYFGILSYYDTDKSLKEHFEGILKSSRKFATDKANALHFIGMYAVIDIACIADIGATAKIFGKLREPAICILFDNSED